MLERTQRTRRAAWVVTVALAVAGCSRSSAPSASATGAVAGEIKVAVVGVGDFKLEPKDDGFSLRGPGVDHLVLARTAQGFALRDRGNVALEARREGAAILVRDGAGALVRTAQRDDEGLRLLGPGGALVARIKIKPDKFNVYDGAGARLRHGKQKEDGFSVKDEGREERAIKVKGVRSLGAAAIFALPIDFREAALLWAAGAGPP